MRPRKRRHVRDGRAALTTETSGSFGRVGALVVPMQVPV